MGFLNDVTSADKIISKAGSSNIMIQGGNASANIEAHAQNAAITTGNGNQTIKVDVTDVAYIDTGCKGKDNISGNAGTAIVMTHDDDDMVVLDCDSLYLDVGDGADTVKAKTTQGFNIQGGDGDKTIVIESKGNGLYGGVIAPMYPSYPIHADSVYMMPRPFMPLQNTITLGDGNHSVEAYANNVNLTVGDGNSIMGVVGDHAKITAGDGNQTVGFYGNYIDIKLGDGNHDVRTMDAWFEAYNDDNLKSTDSWYKAANKFATTYVLPGTGYMMGAGKAMENKTLAADGNGNQYYYMSGASNVNLTMGNGTLQGLVTIGDGYFNLKQGDATAYRNVDIATGSNGKLQEFKEGYFLGQNGYYIPAD